MQMTLEELSNIYNHRGYDVALAVLEDANLLDDEEEALRFKLEDWEFAKMFRYTRPSRYPAAFDPHEF